MAGKQSYTKSEVLRAIRADPDAPKAPPSTNDDASILAGWQDDKRFSSYGHIPTIAARLGCSEQTVRNYVNKTIAGELTKKAQDIRAAIEAERQLGFLHRAEFHYELIRDAEKGLHTNVKLLDTPSIRFVLERLDKAHYASRSEMTGADGENLFDDDAQRALAELGQMLDDLGQNPSETMIDAVNAMKSRLEAIKNKGKDNTPSIERGADDG